MPHLDERQRRVLAGTTARVLGRGGIISVCEATGMSRSTLGDGVAEVDAGVESSVRVRRPRAGRKRLGDTDPRPPQAPHHPVDTKKKEVLGNLANKGKEYQPKGQPERVEVHDFPDPALGKAIPFGVYDINANEGFVVVGDDHDTAAFAVATIGRWWDMVGSLAYPEATRLLITADAGGSNSYRNRLWKVELAKLADRAGLDVTVCHFPPGTSKWNKIEHRLFSHLSMNWRGRPLTDHEVVVNLIGSTTTSTGLRVRAERDTGTYPLGTKVKDKELAALPMVPHEFQGRWNYTISRSNPPGAP